MFSGNRQSVLSVATVCAVLVLASSLWLVPTEAAGPAATYSRTAFKATNNQRKQENLKPLRQSDCLQRFANRWARKMGRGVGLEHQSLAPILRRCDLTMVGENIAVGYPTGRAVVRAWMHSEGHRENILRPRYRLMAIGAYRDDGGSWWTSQVFGRG